MSNYSRQCPSLYRGIVESIEDPENLGRCKIRVPSIHGELTYPIDILPWARPLVLSPVGKDDSGKVRGSVNLPDKGDIVWVFFEGAVKEFPVYLGGTYAKGELEIDQDIVDFYIEGDSKISYHRKENYYMIQIGDTKVRVSKGLIELLGDTKITGDLTVSGTATFNNIIINGSCNRECDCP